MNKSVNSNLENYYQRLVTLLSKRDGVDYTDKDINPANIPLSVIPLLKSGNKKVAIEHLLQELIQEYNPQYNHQELDKIFVTAIDYLDMVEKSLKDSQTVINNVKNNMLEIRNKSQHPNADLEQKEQVSLKLSK